MLLAALGLANTGVAAAASGDFGCSAWLTYWDADAALMETAAFPEGFESLICFEAYFDLNGDWLLPPESEALLTEMKKGGAPVYLSLVNDVQQADGSFVQKSKDFLREQLLTPAARSAHIAHVPIMASAPSFPWG